MKILKEAWKKLWNGTHPKSKGIYAVNGGDFLGEFFVYMETKDEIHFFLSLPKMQKREVPNDNFVFGLDNKIIEQVENLPSSTYDVCRAQYEKDINEDITN